MSEEKPVLVFWLNFEFLNSNEYDTENYMLGLSGATDIVRQHPRTNNIDK